MKFARYFLILILLGMGIGCYAEKIKPPVKYPDESEAFLKKVLNSEPEILTAIKNNDLAKVKAIIESGVNVNAKYSDPGYEIPEGMERVSFSRDPDKNTRMEYTALIEAVRLNKFEIAKYLLEKGADVKAVEHKGVWERSKFFSALDYAKQNNNAEMIKLLEERINPIIKPVVPTKEFKLEYIEKKTNTIEAELKGTFTLNRFKEIRNDINAMLAEVKQIKADRDAMRVKMTSEGAIEWKAEGEKITNLIKKIEDLNKLVQ